jgi:thiamine-phosphate pyrophosphorylase
VTGPRDRLEAARLYVITPERDADAVVAIARAALEGGADVIQLRHKSMARGQLLDLARRLRAVTADAIFIVNDYVDIALLSGADGVHLGADDISVDAARKVGSGLIIGASASTPDAARAAVASGADYIGCGPAFATPVKTTKQLIGPRGVAGVAAAVSAPVFAIGGIEESNLAELTALGVGRACVIRAVGDAADPASAARRLRAMLGQ